MPPLDLTPAQLAAVAKTLAAEMITGSEPGAVWRLRLGAEATHRWLTGDVAVRRQLTGQADAAARYWRHEIILTAHESEIPVYHVTPTEADAKLAAVIVSTDLIDTRPIRAPR